MTSDHDGWMRRHYQDLALTFYSLLPEIVDMCLRERLPAEEQAFIVGLTVDELRLAGEMVRVWDEWSPASEWPRIKASIEAARRPRNG